MNKYCLGADLSICNICYYHVRNCNYEYLYISLKPKLDSNNDCITF